MVLLLILVFIIIILYEVPELIKKKYWRELIVFSALLTIGFVLSLLQTLGYTIPSPVEAIENIINTFIK